IARGMQRIDSLERSVVRPSKQRTDYERLVTEFNGIAADRRLIDAHIEHNWFWQRAIAADTARFVDASRMIDSALRGGGAARVAMAAMPRVRMLLEDSEPGSVTIRIPVATDIEDTAFVRAAQAAIERLWTNRVNGREYQVRLDVRFISPRILYCGAASSPCTAPTRGSVIDLASHVARFPA